MTLSNRISNSFRSLWRNAEATRANRANAPNVSNVRASTQPQASYFRDSFDTRSARAPAPAADPNATSAATAAEPAALQQLLVQLLTTLIAKLSGQPTAASGATDPGAVDRVGGDPAAEQPTKPYNQVPGFDFGKLQDLTHVNDKYTAAVRCFSQAIGGLPPTSDSLPKIVDYAHAHGFPNAKVTGADTIDWGDGHGKIDCITDVGGPHSTWWFNNQP